MLLRLSFLLWREENVSRDGLKEGRVALSPFFSQYLCFLFDLTGGTVSLSLCLLSLLCALLSPRGCLESCWPKSMKGAQLMQPISFLLQGKTVRLFFSCPSALSANVAPASTTKKIKHCIFSIYYTAYKTIFRLLWNSKFYLHKNIYIAGLKTNVHDHHVVTAQRQIWQLCQMA